MVFTKIAIKKVDKESQDGSVTSPNIISPRFQDLNPAHRDDLDSPSHRMGAKLETVDSRFASHEYQKAIEKIKEYRS